jgi:hypothetical protein
MPARQLSRAANKTLTIDVLFFSLAKSSAVLPSMFRREASAPASSKLTVLAQTFPHVEYISAVHPMWSTRSTEAPRSISSCTIDTDVAIMSGVTPLDEARLTSAPASRSISTIIKLAVRVAQNRGGDPVSVIRLTSTLYSINNETIRLFP